MNNATPAPTSSRSFTIRVAGAMIFALTVACSEKPAEKAAAAPPVKPLVDTSVPTIFGVAVNRTPGSSDWCLITSRPEVGTGRLVKVLFTSQRDVGEGKLGKPYASCTGPDTVPGAFAWGIDFKYPVPTNTFPGIVLRDDVWGNVNQGPYADYDLNGDNLRDTITICTNGTVARFRMKWAGDVPRRGWTHELPYTGLEQPNCPDAAPPVAAVDTQPAGIMFVSQATVGPRYELPYDREWLVLRTQELGDETRRSELLKTTVLPMKQGSCKIGVGDTRRLIASASPSYYIALLSAIPGLTEGVVESAERRHFGPGSIADSIRLTMKDRTLLLRRETVGVNGFRIMAETDGAIIRLYEAASSEYGRFSVAWAGDLDRDGDIDVVYTAQPNNWQDASYLLLSGQRTRLAWPNAASWRQEAC